MKLYYLQSPAKSQGDLIDIPDKQHRISDYFIWNTGDGKFLKFTKPKGIAQEYLTKDELKKSDYVHCNMSIPIFSERARDLFGAEIAEEVEFHEISVVASGEEMTFHMCKCLKKYEIIDKNASEYQLLPDGSSILIHPVFNDISHDFHIARDSDESQIFVASQKLFELCKKNKLSIDFLAVRQNNQD